MSSPLPSPSPPPSTTTTMDPESSLTRHESNEYFDAAFLAEDANADATSVSSETTPELPEHIVLERLETDDSIHFHDTDDGQWYGKPLDPQVAIDLCPSTKTGLVWKAEVVPDIWWDSNDNNNKKKLIKGLTERDFDVSNKSIKPHRGTLPLTQKELLSSLTKTPDDRLIFHGKLNGWPQLQALELNALDRKRPLPFGKAQYSPVWSSHQSKGKQLVLGKSAIYRATLCGPDWTGIGWSEASPGFVFWFEAHQSPARLTYGTNLLHTLNRDDRVSHVHMISHRYAVRKESPRDMVTYHSVVLLEWEHGKYCTVVEGAYLNGIGGAKCRSNWYQDKDDDNNLLSQHVPDEMIGPWRTAAGEIRCYDVLQTNLDEFMAYLELHKGNEARFVDPQITFSHVARLTFRTKRDLAQYLLNYVGRDCSYQELRKNCQTLAADLCAFLAGKRSVDPFHPLVQMEYRNKTYQFLYDSNMY
jgi:hypothetical protein